MLKAIPNTHPLKKHAASISCILLSLSLYFRWLPIYSGLLLLLGLSIYIILFINSESKNRISKPLILLSACTSIHILRITQDSWTLGFQPIFRMDILNITTITALLLLLRTIELKYFFERLSLSQILSGTILAFTPALLLIFLISFNLNPDAVSYFSTVYLDFLSSNIDYNVIAFLLLLSLNSLLFCKFSDVTVLTLSTLISMGILYSSSRRAFIILALLVPASFLLRFIFGQRKGIAVAFGIILSFILTIGVVFYALAFPIKNNKVATATVQPLLRPLSLFLIPEDFNKLHYKIIFQIENHKKYNTDDVTFSRSVGELALAPRQSRIESAKEIICAFKPTHHLFGHSFHLRTFGIAHDTKLDYPHNFLISTYLSAGLLGLFLNIFAFVLAFLGFWKERNTWGWEPTMAFSITILFSLTSGFSQWSFLPLALYLTIGLVAFFKSPSPASLT